MSETETGRELDDSDEEEEEEEEEEIDDDKVSYSDDLFIRTRLFPVDISGLTSFPDYWIAH